LDEVECFIRNPPGSGRLTVGRLLFYLGRRLATEELEDEVRGSLVQFVEEDRLLDVLVGVLLRLVDFSVYSEDPESLDRVLSFCIKYFRVHGPKSWQIFRTLDVGRLGTEQLERLYRLEGAHWCWQHRSVVGALIEARRRLEQRERELTEFRAFLTRATSLRQFLPSMKKGKLSLGYSKETGKRYDIPDGIIAHLTRECGGNVQDCHVVDVTCGSFEKETHGVNPHSGVCDNNPDYAAKNAADLEADSRFVSPCRSYEEDIPHTRNNWVCFDFRERRIVPTHYTIRTNELGTGLCHLKSWLVETSPDGEDWQEVAREKDNKQLNGVCFSGTFAVADGGDCRFIRLVNIGRNHFGNDRLCISAWEIFGSLIE
jgi:hypothetical protein